MHAFTCDRCGQLVFFHNDACLACGADLAFDPDAMRIVLVDDPSQRCANAEVAACNWLAHVPGERCASCLLTRTRPADDDVEALGAFAAAEADKRRLLFGLRSLGLDLEPRDEGAGTGVAFDLLSSRQEPVTTGHASGVITLDLAESDDVHREQVRTLLREPYRTVLGHFRHEIGHALFPVLVRGDDVAEARALFGDEREDYQAALDRHYADGAPAGWADRHVSEYATMHPSEDWAETFAHYLHVRATLQTAAAYRVHVDGPDVSGGDRFASDPGALDPTSIDDVVATWLPLSYALNAISRSLGERDLYPFVLPGPVIEKLAFVHRMVRRAADAS